MSARGKHQAGYAERVLRECGFFKPSVVDQYPRRCPHGWLTSYRKSGSGKWATCDENGTQHWLEDALDKELSPRFPTVQQLIVWMKAQGIF